MAKITQFLISERYADGVTRRAVDVDVAADTLYIQVEDQRLTASPHHIDWLIEALTKAKKLIEGEQA